MIIPSWITMREQWSGLAGVGNDGIKTWDTAPLSLGLTSANISVYRTGVGIYWQFTAPAAADWFLSQPTDWLTVSELSSTSVRVERTAAGIAMCAPSGLNDANKRRLFRNVWMYVRRQSNGAICACDCTALVLQANESTITL